MPSIGNRYRYRNCFSFSKGIGMGIETVFHLAEVLASVSKYYLPNPGIGISIEILFANPGISIGIEILFTKPRY